MCESESSKECGLLGTRPLNTYKVYVYKSPLE